MNGIGECSKEMSIHKQGIHILNRENSQATLEQYDVDNVISIEEGCPYDGQGLTNSVYYQ